MTLRFMATVVLIGATLLTNVSLAQNTNQPSDLRRQAVSHYCLGNKYFWHGCLALANLELQEAIVYWPNLTAAHRDLCLINLFSGHLQQALAQLMMAIGLGEPIPLDAVELDALNRQACQAHYKQGLIYGAKGNWSDAVAEFQYALSYQPADAAICHSLAFAYSNTKNFAQAEDFYQKTFDINPLDPFSHADFAFMLADNGQREQAEQQLTQAVNLMPKAAALRVDLGWIAEANGKLDQAEEQFRQACNLSPNHSGLWAHLGKILEQQGKKEQAVDAYQHALQIDPKDNIAQSSLSKLKNL